MAKLVRNVTVVDTNNESSETVFKSKGKGKKKVTRWLRPGERLIRKTLKAQERCWGNALTRHDKSRGKKRDRWITDGLSNSLKAVEKGCRVWRI